MRIWRTGCEGHVFAEVVAPFFAADAAPAGKAGLECHAVAWNEGRDGWADFVNGPGGFVAEYQGRAGEDGVRADGAVGPPVDLKLVSMSDVLRTVVLWYRVVYG